MKLSHRIALLAGLFLLPALAHAQSGCVNSPECPTAVLALAGTAGAGVVSLYRKFRGR